MKHSELKVLSEISRDIDQVFFGSIVITPLVIRDNDKDWLALFLGTIGTGVFWWMSLRFGRQGNI